MPQRASRPYAQDRRRTRKAYDDTRNRDDITRRFNNSRAWKATSRAFLMGKVCEECSTAFAAVSHHRIRAKEYVSGATDEREALERYCDTSNLMALCKSCHDRITRREGEAPRVTVGYGGRFPAGESPNAATGQRACVRVSSSTGIEAE